MVAQSFSENAATTKLVADVGDDDMILDIGPMSQRRLAMLFLGWDTVVEWAVGVFEFPAFAQVQLRLRSRS